jgi:glycosyltransferase involved in cell wall biosynthesis
MSIRCVRILGTRGVPAAHGGFETFAEHLSLYLVERGWQVVVYCQEDGSGPIFEDQWKGVTRVRIPVTQSGPKGTIVFDWLATRHASRYRNLCLTLGYNTAVFCAVLRIAGVPNIINMDGIEWARAKWGAGAKAWFWLNDWAGCVLGNHLVADHPKIAEHLRTRVSGEKITMIPYGADDVTEASSAPVTALGLESGRYLTLIARPEPENSILEVVGGFSRKPRGFRLAVLGNYSDGVPYHQAVKAAASREVVFLGAIYDKSVVQALRFHSAAYIHGHQVGGTNPSLVEALGAGNAVIAHDNAFNRWVAGSGASYFSDAKSFSRCLDEVITDPSRMREMRQLSIRRFQAAFSWLSILGAYESLLDRFLPPGKRA